MSGGYVTNLDPALVASVQEELTRKEQQQIRHYAMLSELQKMCQELPGKYQQRLPYDILCELANALLDGTVFEIVRSLREVQQLEERSLHAQRTTLINESKNAKQALMKKQRELIQETSYSRPHQLAYVQAQNEKELQNIEQRYEEELKRKDMKIILELDQKVSEQQSTLEKAGVPGFTVTNKPNEVKIQMYLLEFITRLTDKTDLPP